MTKLAAGATLAAGVMLLTSCSAGASEYVTLRNGFHLVCDYREVIGGRIRIYTDPESFVEVSAAEIVDVEQMPLAPQPKPQGALPGSQARSQQQPSPAELHELMAGAGKKHNLEVDLLASVIRAESGGNVRAVSRTGAQGLMQLMPGTATDLGVTDSFQPGQNINGGTAYLDGLLAKYHDNLALALAAYNAGPAAVDRYQGIPPYRETRAYVARVIREFNRLCRMRATALKQHAETLRLPTEPAVNTALMPLAAGLPAGANAGENR